MGRSKARSISFRIHETVWLNLDEIAKVKGEEGPNGLARAVMETMGQSEDGMTPNERRLWEVINYLVSEVQVTRLSAESAWQEVTAMRVMLETLCRNLLKAEDCEAMFDFIERPDVGEKLMASRVNGENGHGTHP